MASTARLPSPYPSFVEEYTVPELKIEQAVAEDADADAVNQAFFAPSFATTEPVYDLIQTLKNDLDRLSTENATLLAALSEAHVRMSGSAGAYNALKARTDELERENAMLRSELADEADEMGDLENVLAEMDGQIEELRRQVDVAAPYWISGLSEM